MDDLCGDLPEETEGEEHAEDQEEAAEEGKQEAREQCGAANVGAHRQSPNLPYSKEYLYYWIAVDNAMGTRSLGCY